MSRGFAAARTALIWMLVLAALEAALRLMDVPSYILPTPSGVARAFATELPSIAWHSWITVQEILYGLAAVGAVLGEFIGSDNGIGYLVLSASRTLDGDLLYASLVILVVLCLGFSAIVDQIERWLLPMSGVRAL